MKKEGLSELQREVYEDLERAAKKISAPYFTREGLAEIANGVISGSYLTFLDSRGEGPEGSFYIGRRRVYPKRAALLWLAKRVRGGVDAD